MKSCLIILFSFCLITHSLDAAATRTQAGVVRTMYALAHTCTNFTPARTRLMHATHNYSTYIESEHNNFNKDNPEQEKNDPTNVDAGFNSVRVIIDVTTARLENAAYNTHTHAAHASGTIVDAADTAPIASTAGDAIGSAADAASSAATNFEFPSIDGECCIQ